MNAKNSTYEFTGVSVIIGTKNETNLLEETVRVICGTCRAADVTEIILVTCAASTPENKRTAEKLRDSAGEIPVVVYEQIRPGVGMACREAFGLARGSHVITMAADCEMDPRAVAVMIERAKELPGSIITTSRRIEGGGFDGYNRVKQTFSFFFQKMLRVVYGTKLTDITNCYQISPTPLMRAINFEEDRHPFFLESNLKPMKLGVHFMEIPCMWRRRNDGNQKISFFHCFTYLRIAFKVRFQKKDALLKKTAEGGDLNFIEQYVNQYE